MNYKTYAEAKIANTDCDIFSNGVGFSAIKNSPTSHFCNAWVTCNPANYCSTLKEFLDAGFKLVEGDKFIEVAGYVYNVDSDDLNLVNERDSGDCDRYILSSAALNGGCKIGFIGHKSEPWTIYNNTLPLSELSDEQAAMLFNAWRVGGEVECTNATTKDLRSGLTAFEWSIPSILNWDDYLTYRIKQKSERELFIETSAKLMTSETERTMEQMFGAQFDAGARYTDLTQYFGENI